MLLQLHAGGLLTKKDYKCVKKNTKQMEGSSRSGVSYEVFSQKV